MGNVRGVVGGWKTGRAVLRSESRDEKERERMVGSEMNEGVHEIE